MYLSDYVVWSKKMYITTGNTQTKGVCKNDNNNSNRKTDTDRFKYLENDDDGDAVSGRIYFDVS